MASPAVMEHGWSSGVVVGRRLGWWGRGAARSAAVNGAAACVSRRGGSRPDLAEVPVVPL